MFGLHALAPCLCAAVCVLAATVDFRGVVHIVGGGDVTGEDVQVDSVGTYQTTDSGEFVIPASTGLEVGAEVIFHVKHWVVVRPCELKNGRTYLPPPKRGLELKVLKRGDPRLKSLASAESILGCLIEEAASQFPKRPALDKHPESSWRAPPAPFTGAKITTRKTNLVRGAVFHEVRSKLEFAEVGRSASLLPATSNASFAQVESAMAIERGRFLASKAEELGFSADELKSAIDSWATSRSEPYEKGLAALWEGRFAEASTLISESSLGASEEGVKRYVPLARAEFERGNYTEAAAALRRMLVAHGNDSVALSDLRIVVEAEGPSGGEKPFSELSPIEVWQHLGTLERVVIIILFIMSGWSIGVMIDRWMAYSAARKQSRIFAHAVATALREGRIDEALKAAQLNKKSHIARVVAAGLVEVWNGQSRGEMPEVALQASMQALTRTEAIVHAELKRGLQSLQTIGVVAPVLGFLGTVIGITQAFESISSERGLAWLASSTAEALAVMAVALLVAIPAGIMFSYFAKQVKSFDVEMDNASSELMGFLRQSGRQSGRRPV
jgi:biopolymer transport protein ExbB/biopolymer transport protein TolQ